MSASGPSEEPWERHQWAPNTGEGKPTKVTPPLTLLLTILQLRWDGALTSWERLGVMKNGPGMTGDSWLTAREACWFVPSSPWAWVEYDVCDCTPAGGLSDKWVGALWVATLFCGSVEWSWNTALCRLPNCHKACFPRWRRLLSYSPSSLKASQGPPPLVLCLETLSLPSLGVLPYIAKIHFFVCPISSMRS